MINPWEAANDRLKEYPNNVDEYVEFGAPGKSDVSENTKRGILRNFWRMFGECLWMWIIRSAVLQWFSGNLCKNGNLTDKPKQCKWCPDSERIIPRKAYLQGTTTNNSVCFQDAPTRVMHISAKLMLCYWSWPNVAGRIWENTFPKS